MPTIVRLYLPAPFLFLALDAVWLPAAPATGLLAGPLGAR